MLRWIALVESVGFVWRGQFRGIRFAPGGCDTANLS